MISHDQFQKQVVMIQGMEQAFHIALRAANSVIDQYGFGFNDIRVSMFGKNSGILNSAVVSLYFLQNHLTHRKWWEQTYGPKFPIFEKAVPDTIKCFDGQAKSALYLGITANVESAFRILLRAVDPTVCDGGLAAFATIYDCLLTKVGLQRDKNIYDLLRHIRNTRLHSDGVFLPAKRKDVEVSYQNHRYNFKVGIPFNEASWNLAISLSKDLTQSMFSVITARPIVRIKEIYDPQKIANKTVEDNSL